ncbi:MAG: penicillin-binding protein 2 [Candidatus Saccharimonadales bacterium]
MKLELQKRSRSNTLAVILFLVMTIFVVRLFYLQIIRHDYYVERANSEQIKRLTIPAKRGLIYALDGDNEPVPLVLNQTIYTVFADPYITTDDKKIVEVIKKIAGGNARSNLDKLLSYKDTRYQILATKITRKQADKIKSENLKGVGFQEESQRVYPEGSLASQTLGFLNYEGKGVYGVEAAMEQRLAGKDGLLQSVTDVSSVPLTIGDNNIDIPAKNGDNLVLSIDRNIQSRVEQALRDGIKRTGAMKASAIVINPHNGQVMAMANSPTFNPQKLQDVKDVSVFNNDVVSVPYEPGSVIKSLTIAIGIDKGAVTPNSTYNNTDSIRVDDRVIQNAYLGETGVITFQHALNWSLNTGFVTIAQRLGDGKNITRQARDIMYDYYHDKFKLGQLTGIEVANEAPGIIISPDQQEGNAVRYSNMAFGQGMELTMVQVASAFSSIVNGGKYYTPTIIDGFIDENGVYTKNSIKSPSRTVAESTANQVRDMIHNARSIFIHAGDKPGYFIGGKTGTSQVIRNGVYSNDESIGTYIGFGGSKDESKYVIMVQVSGEHQELEGGIHALPIFTDISNWMLDYLRIQPER